VTSATIIIVMAIIVPYATITSAITAVPITSVRSGGQLGTLRHTVLLTKHGHVRLVCCGCHKIRQRTRLPHHRGCLNRVGMQANLHKGGEGVDVWWVHLE